MLDEYIVNRIVSLWRSAAEHMKLMQMDFLGHSNQ